MGCPIPEHDPLKLIVGLCLCDQCFELELSRAQDWINLPGYKKLFEIVSRGFAPPDFARTYIEKVSFDSREWKVLKRE